jgi:hypothetical protein
MLKCETTQEIPQSQTSQVQFAHFGMTRLLRGESKSGGQQTHKPILSIISIAARRFYQFPKDKTVIPTRSGGISLYLSVLFKRHSFSKKAGGF